MAPSICDGCTLDTFTLSEDCLGSAEVDVDGRQIVQALAIAGVPRLQTLFAAFEVATGKVTAAHKKRRRHIEFLDFMNDIVAAWPDKAIHVVLDNLNTHKPRKRPLAQAASERGVPLHADPGLMAQPGGDLVSILQDQSLSDQSFTSVKQLREHIDAFVDAYNVDAKPFVWTKSEVHQKCLKARFADQ